MRIRSVTAVLLTVCGYTSAATLSSSDSLTVVLPTGTITQMLYENTDGQDVDAAGNPTNVLQISESTSDNLSSSIAVAALSEPSKAMGQPAVISDVLIYYTTAAITPPIIQPAPIRPASVSAQDTILATRNWVLISDKDGGTYTTLDSFVQANASSFASLINGLALNNSSIIVETGLPQDVTKLLGSPYDVTVASDIEVVPVPASTWFFGSGLLSLIGMACKRKNTE